MNVNSVEVTNFRQILTLLRALIMEMWGLFRVVTSQSTLPICHPRFRKKGISHGQLRIIHLTQKGMVRKHFIHGGGLISALAKAAKAAAVVSSLG